MTVPLCIALAVGLAAGLPRLGADSVGSVDFPGATYVEAQRMGDGWQVRRSDGTSLRLDPELEDGRAAVALSPDGRWLSYAQGPAEGGLLALYLQRSDQAEAVRVPRVHAMESFPHRWSPDSSRLLVPVADGDVNLVDTERRLLEHQYPPGSVAGFVDERSVGMVQHVGNHGDEGLEWVVTNLDMSVRDVLPLDVDSTVLDPPGWAQLWTRQASLSPDGSRVAALLGEHRGRLRLLVFSTIDGALIQRRDTTVEEVDPVCQMRWKVESPELARAGDPCRLSASAAP